MWDEEFDFVVGAYELESGQKIRMEVWDWDANGKREFMGSVRSFDTKKVIARVLLMAGQASKVLKYTEELEETSGGEAFT